MSQTQTTPTPSEDGSTNSSRGGVDDVDVSFLVEDILEQMQKKFTTVGNNIMGRMDEMGRRMDELERSVGDLMEDAARTPTSTTTTATTPLATHSEATEDATQGEF